ncbi:hypothetical protein GO497_02985 [Acidovorax citrulli]|nr:hypothetical protein [Paracidovorax citrulli]
MDPLLPMFLLNVLDAPSAPFTKPPTSGGFASWSAVSETPGLMVIRLVTSGGTAITVSTKKIAATGNRRSDWRRLDLLEWEEKNGPVPEGFIVYCPPGLERTPENLSIRRAKISTEEKELLHLKAEFSRRIAELKRLSRTPVALTTPQPCQTYTAADDALIEQLCDTHTHAQIAERLGRSTKSVGNRIYRLQGKR